MDFYYPIPEDCQELIKDEIPEALCYRIGKKEHGSRQANFIPQYFDDAKKGRIDSHICDWMGASVFTCMEAALRKRKLYPMLGDILLAGRIVASQHGPMMYVRSRRGKKSPEHLNWFQHKNAVTEKIFHLCPGI